MTKKSSPVTARNVTVNSKEASHIAGNTQILFTVNSFFALIGSMLGLFFGFYMLVVNPKLNDIQDRYDTLTKEMNEIKLEMKTLHPETPKTTTVEIP
jgi:hypothetical protein